MRVLRMGMSGSDVMEIQAMLRKLGHQIAADGIFGPDTRRAVIEFQREYGLHPDGVVGNGTYAVMQRYLLGYASYTVKPGDTFYTIARRFGTSIALLAAANPGVDPDALMPGRTLAAPYGYPVVDTDINYTYDVLQRDIQGLMARYPFAVYGVAGQSALGRSLYYIRLGSGPNQVFYTAAIHALEWITSPVLMKFAEDLLSAVATGGSIDGYDAGYIWNTSSIYIVPMVNPDGIELVLNGLQPGNPNHDELIRWNNGSTDFSTDWEANNNGVDLNHNFNAAWEESRQAATDMGITGPGPTRYPGAYPESEPESRALADFTRSHDFRLVLAYHSQGEVIYWNFMGLEPPEARTIGEALAADSGYTLEQATGITSYGGFKDWFIQDYRRPGYTVEVGRGRNPLSISQFGQIYSANLPLLLHAAVI
jgi:g-D-glutamyl-meso-diaminopimelate peptidase